MLTIPALLGLAVTRWRAGAGCWALPGLLLSFLAQDGLVQAAHAVGRRSSAYVRARLLWGLVYLAGAAVCFLALLLAAPAAARPAILRVAVPSAAAAGIWGVHSAVRRGRALWSELVGLAGMALVAPLTGAAAGLPLAGPPLGAAAMAYIYSLSSVTYVRTYERRRAAPALSAAVAVAVHLLLATAVGLLVRSGSVPPWALLAFLPVLLRLGLAFLAPPQDLRALGRRELWVAVSFTLVCAVSFWISA